MNINVSRNSYSHDSHDAKVSQSQRDRSVLDHDTLRYFPYECSILENFRWGEKSAP